LEKDNAFAWWALIAQYALFALPALLVCPVRPPRWLGGAIVVLFVFVPIIMAVSWFHRQCLRRHESQTRYKQGEATSEEAASRNNTGGAEAGSMREYFNDIRIAETAMKCAERYYRGKASELTLAFTGVPSSKPTFRTSLSIEFALKSSQAANPRARSRNASGVLCSGYDPRHRWCSRDW
jgi:hypothetical protein